MIDIKNFNLSDHFGQRVLHAHEGGTLEEGATLGQEARVNFGIGQQTRDAVNPAAVPASDYTKDL